MEGARLVVGRLWFYVQLGTSPLPVTEKSPSPFSICWEQADPFETPNACPETHQIVVKEIASNAGDSKNNPASVRYAIGRRFVPWIREEIRRKTPLLPCVTK